MAMVNGTHAENEDIYIPRKIENKIIQRIMKANLQRKGSTPRHVVLEFIDVAAFVMVVLMVVLIVKVTEVCNGR